MEIKLKNPVHAGMVLQEYMDAGLWTVAKLSKRMKMTRANLNLIRNGRVRITARTALKLEPIFGRSPELWLAIQAQYDIAKARKQMRKRKST